MSSPALRTARVARQTRLSALKASPPSSVRSLASVYGKSAIAGMPSATASSAALATRSTLMRSTPGMDSTGMRLPFPSVTNIGQIRSAGVSTFSATSRRDHPALRLRRMRTAGKRPTSACGGGSSGPARLGLGAARGKRPGERLHGGTCAFGSFAACCGANCGQARARQGKGAVPPLRVDAKHRVGSAPPDPLRRSGSKLIEREAALSAPIARRTLTRKSSCS